MATSQTQYIDLRGSKYDGGLKVLVNRLGEIESARKPPHVLISDAYAGWYDHSDQSLGFGLSGYVTIQLDEPPYNKERDQRLRNEQAIVFSPSKYNTLQAFLDDLYSNYLRERFPPLTYGARWVLEERSETPGGIHPKRLLVPWEWLDWTDLIPIAERKPYWGRAQLDQYGLLSGSVWMVREPEHADRFGNTARAAAFGVAVNNETLLTEILEGPGKQPHPPYRAGFLDWSPSAEVDTSAYRHLLVVLDGWSGRPFAGRALRETAKMFDASRLQEDW